MHVQFSPPADFDFATQCDGLFTNVFHQVNEAQTRFIVVYGGAGSSKSYSVHQHALLSIMQDGIGLPAGQVGLPAGQVGLPAGQVGLPAGQAGDTLVMRKFAADLRESCFKLFKQLIYTYGLQEHFRFYYSNDNRRITYIHNGRSLVFKGIDDPQKLKSIVAFSSLLVEEATQLEFEDFLELNRRLRGMSGIRITLILNPISENHWIKTKLCDATSPYADQTTIVQCTYADNRNSVGQSFLTGDDIRELERLKDINENQYRIYVMAQWGVDNKEGKFCWAFNRSQIVPTTLDGEQAVWASFDFNVNPLTCTIAQVFPDTKTLRAIECIKLEHSDIWKMCQRLNAAYPCALWFITGDATGQNRSAMVRDNMNYYHIIRQELNLSMQQIMVPTVNPLIEHNQLLVNGVHKNWKVEIDPVRCQPLIYDLTYVEVTGEGEIIKDRSSNKKYADFLDNWRYLINMAVKRHFDFWAKE